MFYPLYIIRIKGCSSIWAKIAIRDSYRKLHHQFLLASSCRSDARASAQAIRMSKTIYAHCPTVDHRWSAFAFARMGLYYAASVIPALTPTGASPVTRLMNVSSPAISCSSDDILHHPRPATLIVSISVVQVAPGLKANGSDDRLPFVEP